MAETQVSGAPSVAFPRPLAGWEREQLECELAWAAGIAGSFICYTTAPAPGVLIFKQALSLLYEKEKLSPSMLVLLSFFPVSRRKD